MKLLLNAAIKFKKNKHLNSPLETITIDLTSYKYCINGIFL